MTRIDSEPVVIDSAEVRDDSTASLQTAETDRPQQPQRPQNEEHRHPANGNVPGPAPDSPRIPISNLHIEENKPTSQFEDLKNIYKQWTKQDALIAVMGMTGSGKTTFISKVTGREDLKIGHGLTSCTQDIQVAETVIDGRVVRFVDTPGFSDTYLSDTEILEMIADYLKAAYNDRMRLSGIIYIHPISENRITHHATKNLAMFRKLTGEKNLEHVVLTTSMWDRVTPEESESREKELQTKFWNLLMIAGAKYSRHNGSAQSARGIASSFLENKPFYVQLQEEVGKQHKPLKDTLAGKEIMAEISRLKEQHREELEEAKELMRQSAADNNEAAIAALKQHYDAMIQDMNKTLADERRMNQEATASMQERISYLENKGSCAVM
ncbi:P-loop containing nucleoside triphosphate hydrolase protein [Hypoxylon trugodes]|uniref:P-loop containing nucleoside triphosphate hydrolase protein n=1 Tax=Hypoxylon trugodes TaxID=326681 RepID=UPI002197A385|nr:P-loop containing nucleoside triphosphate hydrolase protein [Hypoxylon trugodes]KAI1390221.1 P-loop containing nucleoside triphosphate hydrolase protein [Hypoxylon trugodes]